MGILFHPPCSEHNNEGTVFRIVVSLLVSEKDKNRFNDIAY